MALIDVALEKINDAWKNASEEMYKAQQEAGATEAPPTDGADASSPSDDDVEDVDFEEVK